MLGGGGGGSRSCVKLVYRGEGGGGGGSNTWVDSNWGISRSTARREKHPQDARLKLINSTKSGYEEGRAAGARAAGEADSRLKTVRRTSVQSVLETSTAYYQPSPLGFERRNVGVTKSPSVV